MWLCVRLALIEDILTTYVTPYIYIYITELLEQRLGAFYESGKNIVIIVIID